MHILLIGLGNMGQKYMSKLEEMGESTILCDIDPSKANGKSPFYCHYGDVKEPIKNAIIAIDPKDHVKTAKFFLDKGIPVLLEKPPATDPSEFELIEGYPNLYVSEIESYSICLEHFPRNVKSLEIYRLGRGRGYISPLWDLAWHDLYLMYRFFENIQVFNVKKNDVWCIEGVADGTEFKLCVAWEHPNPERKWIINNSEWVLDFAQESVYKDGNLVVHRKRDKLRWMIEDFILGKYDRKSVKRAKRILQLLSNSL